MCCEMNRMRFMGDEEYTKLHYYAISNVINKLDEILVINFSAQCIL